MKRINPAWSDLKEPACRSRRTNATRCCSAEQIGRIARNTASLIGVERELRDADIELDERYHAGTYGIPDETTLEAMRLAARTEGMVTDPVYEGSRWQD
jgi:1-aminocyclopropane-1-carboxylate deaminase